MICGTPQIFADELVTTLSDANSGIIYDGIWTYTTEWKKSSLEKIPKASEDQFVIRIGHDYENMFLFLDVIGDTSINRLGDRAIICFDTLLDKSNKPKIDDYCFQVSLDGKLTTLNGDSNNAISGFYKKVENHPNVIAVGGVSNEFDRYSKVPHVSFEYQIPIDVIGRSSEYGFYVGVFDAQSNQMYSWPENALEDNYPFIPSPDNWGVLLSPDKSIPEFSFSIIFYLMLPIIMGFAIFTKIKFFTLYK